MCFVVDEDPPDWSVSLTQSQDGRRTDRRQTGERQERTERTRQNIRREDTRGHRPRQSTWKRRDDRGDMTGQWWWWWDNRRTTEDNRERGQDREVKREDRDGDMTRTKQEETDINSTWWGQQQTGDTKQEMTQWKTQDSSGTTWRQTRNKWTTWDKSTRRLWGRDDEDDNTRWTRTF